MARYMRPLIDVTGEPILVPVPLHRSRLWSRGFNQAALIARELASGCGIGHDPFVLRRRKHTAVLKGMSPLQRRRQVSGAFDVTRPEQIAGRKIILVDDVLTTGSTANACARAAAGRGQQGRFDLLGAGGSACPDYALSPRTHGLKDCQ